MPNCICGSDKSEQERRPYYKVTADGATVQASNGHKLTTSRCLGCGVERLAKFPYTNSEEAAKYYKKYPPTKETYGAKGYDHDLVLAETRLENYGISKIEKVLDVGSGSGAFVDACRGRGILAYGCEVGAYSDSKSTEFVYPKLLEEVDFPTDHFDRVTCHDVLEHAFDPAEMLGEIFRITKSGGNVIIDFPDFYNDAGKHHWKKEHLWFLTKEALVELVKRSGFNIATTTKPIESKIVVYATKPHQDRVSILLPPGIGDSYWSVTKLKAFIEREKIKGQPSIHIAANKVLQHNGHKRAFPFLEMYPFLHSSGITHEHGKDPELNRFWKEAYAEEGRTIFNDVAGCDWFISYNGWLRTGHEMADLNSDLATDWQPPMFVSLEQDRYKNELKSKYGKYICFYFVFQGTYQHWTKEFPIDSVAAYVNLIAEQAGATPVLVGAKWDAEERSGKALRRKIKGVVDLTGKTSVEQAFGVLRGAECVVGYPSGLTIMSAVMGCPTLIIWNDYYNKDFFWRCAPPATRGTNYQIEVTKNITPEGLTKSTQAVIAGGKFAAHTKTPKLGELTHLSNVSIPPPSSDTMPIRSEAAPAHRRKQTQAQKPRQQRNETRERNRAEAIAKAAVMVPRRISWEDQKPKIHPTMKPTQNIDIVCVYKTGGKYTADHVKILRDSVARNVTVPYNFVAYSDAEVEGVERRALKLSMPGWWSKVEIFRGSGPSLYIDLDTVITGNIDNFVCQASSTANGEFRMLTPFNTMRRMRGRWASGLMAWHGDFAFLYRKLDKYYRELFNGDQDYITHMLRTGTTIQSINDWGNIGSFKRDDLAGMGVKNIDIACFHGSPFPSEVLNIDWVNENWRVGA